MPTDFITLPDELQSLANHLFEELKKRGYRLKIEPQTIELPATPTILALRGHETHYFLVRQAVTTAEIQQWQRYGCSCTTDTRITFFSPSIKIKSKELTNLRALGVGLACLNDSQFQQTLEARDLTFHAQAPDRNQLKPRVKQLLGETLDRLDRGDWRPAFEDACGILEEECRAYLLKGLKMGRVKHQSGNNIKVPTAAQINKMTMGALKDVFCKLISQNQLEANLCSALTKLNPDRIRRIHKRSSKQSEAALRRRVGRHFWLISNILSLMV